MTTSRSRSANPTVTIAGQRLEYHWINGVDPAAPVLVFLHEGLGSVSLWRDFPARLAAATGCPALIYSRRGFGASDPLTAPYRRPPDCLHVEALDILPRVLDHFEINAPVLFGHSDGGTIALIHAGAARRPVTAAIIEAAHVFVEPITLASIRDTVESWRTTDLPRKLARHHHHVEGTFHGWADTWLHPDFHNLDIRDLLPGITCPLLVIQGEDDEYGTSAQVTAIADGVSGPTQSLLIPNCGHSAHRDRPGVVLDATLTFLERHLCRSGSDGAQRSDSEGARPGI